MYKIKKVNLIIISILMLLHIMLYIMLAYLMLLTALFKAVCLHNAYFLPLTFANAFWFHDLFLYVNDT